MCFAKLRAVDAIDGIRNARKMKKYYGFKGWTIHFFLKNNFEMKLPSLVHVIFCIHLSCRVYYFHMLPHKLEKNSGIAYIEREVFKVDARAALLDVKRELLICFFLVSKDSFFRMNQPFTCAHA